MMLFQINFFKDHTKIVIAGERTDVSIMFISGERQSFTYRLSQLAEVGCEAMVRERLVYALSCLRQYAELDGEDVWEEAMASFRGIVSDLMLARPDWFCCYMLGWTGGGVDDKSTRQSQLVLTRSGPSSNICIFQKLLVFWNTCRCA